MGAINGGVRCHLTRCVKISYKTTPGGATLAGKDGTNGAPRPFERQPDVSKHGLIIKTSANAPPSPESRFAGEFDTNCEISSVFRLLRVAFSSRMLLICGQSAVFS